MKRNNYASYLKKDLTIFNKIAIQTRAEMAADKYVVGLSRLKMYESKCILSLPGNCLFWYFCTIAPRLDISLNKNRMTFKFAHDLPVGEFYAMVFFFFSNRKYFFSNLKSPKFTPTLLLCVLAVNGRPGCDPFMSRYVCHR